MHSIGTGFNLSIRHPPPNTLYILSTTQTHTHTHIDGQMVYAGQQTTTLMQAKNISFLSGGLL